MIVSSGNVERYAYLAAHMRDEDWAKFQAVLPFTERSEFADYLERLAPHAFIENIYSVEPEKPIAYLAIIQQHTRLASTMMFTTDAVGAIIRPMIRHFRANVVKSCIDFGLRRVEATTAKDYRQSRRLIEAMGFHAETELPLYGKGGETFIQYARTEEG